MNKKKHGKRYTEEQIVRILKELENGKPLAEICREYGVSDGTVYRWRNKYGGIEKSEVQRLKELEAENRKLRDIVAQQALDIAGLKDVLSKKW
jgi:putative transposase